MHYYDVVSILSNEQTVNRSFVHKSAVSEVFITDSARITPSIWVSAQWPRRHWFFGDPQLRLDPALAMETFRQAWIFVAHRYYHVPLSAHVVMVDIGIDTFVDRAPRSADPSRVLLSINEVAVSRRSRGDASQLELIADMYSEGQPIARAHGQANLLAPATYQRIREQNALTGAEVRCTAKTEPVSFERDHPVFFDHANDHVPGMLLVSVAQQQLAAVEAGTAIEAEFFAYFDLLPPVELHVVGGDRLLRACFHQQGRVGARIEIS